MNQLRQRSTGLDAFTETITDPAACRSDSEGRDCIGRRSPRNLPCHHHDPDLWFAESPRDLDRAKAICATCPVRRECLAGAMQRNEPCGVWGGEILLHGQVIPFKRGRGRPRIRIAAADADAALKSA